MSNFSKLVTIGLLSALLMACGGPREFQMFESKLECTDCECVLFFDIENLTDRELLVNFDISLTQNYVWDPEKNGLIEVGHMEVEYAIPPSRKVTFIQPVSVTEKANGSKLVATVVTGT